MISRAVSFSIGSWDWDRSQSTGATRSPLASLGVRESIRRAGLSEDAYPVCGYDPSP